MVFNRQDWDNRYKLTIDSSKVNEDLTDFPVSIVLSSDTGQTGFDVSDIFDELTVVSGQDGYVYDCTKLLLHCEGDLAYARYDLTTVGSPKMEKVTISGTDVYCITLNGAGDYLITNNSAHHTDFDWGTGDFTVDCWIKPTTVGIADAHAPCASCHNGADWWFGLQAGKLANCREDTTWQNGSTTLTADVWSHIAVVRRSGTTKMYLNGSDDTSGGITDNSNYSSANPLIVGSQVSTASNSFDGSICGVRITKGTALWDSNFTPDVVPVIGSDTKLLLNFEGDSSNSEHDITFNGGTKIDSDYGKFGTSYYFDGNNGYLTAPDSDDWFFGSDDFTIDGWYNFSSLAGTHQCFISQWSAANSGFQFYYEDSSSRLVFVFGWGGAYSHHYSVAWTITLGKWYHISLVRCGNYLYFFIDGVQLGSSLNVTGKTIANSSIRLWIGCYSSNGSSPNTGKYFHGYMSEFRISKGIARWTSNFTPPGGQYGSSWFNRKNIAVTTTVSGVETELYTEIAYWNHTDEEASLWTKVPTIVSGTDTELVLHYDTTQSGSCVGDTGDANAQNVWDSNFKMIQHMNNATSTTTLDSTSNSMDGTKVAVDRPIEVDGKIAKAQDFEASTTDYVSLPSYTFGTLFTLEYIIKPESLQGDVFGATINCCIGTTIGATGGMNFYIGNGSSWGAYLTGPASALSVGTTYHVYVTYDGTTLTSYKDTVYNASVGNSCSIPATTHRLGERVGNWFDGVIDEVRISNVKRSSAWMSATYYSNWDDLITFEDPPYTISGTTYYFEGNVKEKNISVNRVLYLHRRSDGLLIGQTLSSGTGGYFYIETPHNVSHYLVCLDNEPGEVYNDLVRGNILPTSEDWSYDT